MSPHAPTPDEAEQVFILIKWWRELTLGLISLIGTWALVRRGQRVEAVPVYLTDTAIKDMLVTHQTNVSKDMELCKLTLETQMRKEFYNAMRKNNDDLLERFKEIIDAHHG